MTEAKMGWQELMLEGYPGWEPLTFGALDVRYLDRQEEVAEILVASQPSKTEPTVEIPDDIQ